MLQEERCLPFGEVWETTAVPSPETVRSSRPMSPSRMEGRNARREKISWRAASGFPEAGEPLQIRSTVWRAEKIWEGSSASFPSSPIVFAGFLPFFPAGRRADLAYCSRDASQRRSIRS